MQVLKFGGSSVANAQAIQQVMNIVLNSLKKDETIVVVSALGGITDALLNCAGLAAQSDESYIDILRSIETRHLDTVKSLIPYSQQSSVLSLVKKACNEIEDICKGIFLLHELSAKTKDRIVSYGEWLSSQIIHAAFTHNGTKSIWKDSRELIITNQNFTNAGVLYKETNEKIQHFFQNHVGDLYILPGFIASDKNGATTTLGRGGSDYTASIIGAALDVHAVEIWTDVSGMMTADPRLVNNAKEIAAISYQEAMELSHFGAKVIYPPTIQPVMKKGIPVWIKNTFAPEHHGTIIEKSLPHNTNSICGITSINKIALLSLEGSGMVGIPGFSKRLFEALANASINVILITQASSEHSICVGIEEAFIEMAKKVIDETFSYEIETGKVEPALVEKNLSIVALVGDNMKNHTGISGRMFAALGKNGVNVRAIAQGSSERNISAVIFNKDVKKALNALHETFFETTYKQINLFICGVGNVGSKLLSQLSAQQKYLYDNLRLQVKVTGIANSKKMAFDDNGIDLNNWKEILNNGEDMNLDEFASIIKNKNLGNAVFADITANENVASIYSGLLQKSISVVACNKVAASSKYQNYISLKHLAKEYNCHFLFETNVGAGLPVIGTLNDLIRSGDKIQKIEAVLSGTLNFVFNNYDAQNLFSDVVRQAQTEGYTEPDPRLDLSGTDVMRKILILAREAGIELEMDAISNESFMPASCMQGTVEDFYEAMKKEEAHFKNLYVDAKEKNCKLKFVASFSVNENSECKASVGLKHIPPQHDFYHLYGKDNVVLFYTQRYAQQPMVVKGAGAGADVTASGVFADILRTTG